MSELWMMKKKVEGKVVIVDRLQGGGGGGGRCCYCYFVSWVFSRGVGVEGGGCLFSLGTEGRGGGGGGGEGGKKGKKEQRSKRPSERVGKKDITTRGKQMNAEEEGVRLVSEWDNGDNGDNGQ